MEDYRKVVALRGQKTGGAWLSSARVVRCWVKSRNERNPYCQLPASKVGHSGGTAGDKPEEGGDEVKSSCPLYLGLHTYLTMAGTEGSEGASRKGSCKAGPSSDRRLKPACVKSELLVISGQHTEVNTFPGLVHTARHTTKVCNARSRWPNLQRREPSKAGQMIGVKS